MPRTRPADRAARTLLVVAATLLGCSDERRSSPPADLETRGDPADAGTPADAGAPDLAPLPISPELAAYVDLVAQAEQRLKTDPPTVLATMRQLYYGEPWSATSTNAFWRLVIPCSPELTDPRQALGDALSDALTARAETGGVDVGHVFAGLEAMVCPSAQVLMVAMTNEDFATWGGDLGAAVAARSACLALGEAAATTPDCGGRPGGEPLGFYVAHHAPPQDLEGDLDPFAIRAVLTGAPCAASRQVALSLDRPLSDVLGDYYLEPTSALGQARRRRDRCVLEMLGAEWAGDQIANRDAVVGQLAAQIADFAETYYLTIDPAGATAPQLDAMRRDARQVSEDFVAGLTP